MRLTSVLRGVLRVTQGYDGQEEMLADDPLTLLVKPAGPVCDPRSQWETALRSPAAGV